MSLRLIFVFSLIIYSGCSFESNQPISTIEAAEYKIDEGTYAVIVPQSTQAKRVARQKAAEITVAQGRRYFTIQSEGEVRVLKSNGSQDLPTNLYQELIIEGNFGKESIQRQSPPSVTSSSAYRLVFQIQLNQYKLGSIDACKLTECDLSD